MELPVAKASYQPSTDALVRAIKRVNVMLARVLAQETPLDGAVAFTSADLPRIDFANAAYDVELRDGDDPNALLNRIDAHFADAGLTCHMLHSAAAHWPAPLAEAIESRGYAKVTAEVRRLDHYAPPTRVLHDLQIIPARAAYGELHALFTEEARAERGGDDDFADQWARAMIDRLDEPRFEFFLGRIDRRPAGVAGVASLGQMGVIDGVYTAPAYRRRGLCATLMAHTLEHCQRALFEHVILETIPGSDAARLYERMGFRSVATIVGYHRGARERRLQIEN